MVPFSRNLQDCIPELIALYLEFRAKMQESKIPFIVTCTARTYKAQVALYAQGRQPLTEVNALRRIAELAPISMAENARPVTWTLKSKHIIDLDDGDPNNDKSRAFDIAIVRNGKPTWNIKVDVNEDDIPDYRQAAEIGESVGLIAGAKWPKPDYPHFQVAG